MCQKLNLAHQQAQVIHISVLKFSINRITISILMGQLLLITRDMFSNPLVAGKGRLFIAIYNDQGWISRYWTAVKRLYGGFPFFRWPLLLSHAPYLFGMRWLARALMGRLALNRGMSFWHDYVDWVGGYPFEVA